MMKVIIINLLISIIIIIIIIIIVVVVVVAAAAAAAAVATVISLLFILWCIKSSLNKNAVKPNCWLGIWGGVPSPLPSDGLTP